VRTCARVRTARTATAWTVRARAVRAGWAPAVPSHVNRANMAAIAGHYLHFFYLILYFERCKKVFKINKELYSKK
jgi:hypothetical protein